MDFNDEVQDEVRAKRFVLTDDHGNETAYITGADAGFTGFSVQPPDGAGVSVQVGIIAQTNAPAIKVEGSDGASVLISVQEGTDAVISLRDADGASRTIATEASDE